MESAPPMSDRLGWYKDGFGIDYLTVDRMTEGSVMPQPVGWVLLIYGHIPHQRAWREVFETREAAMQAGADWFLALDVVSWD